MMSIGSANRECLRRIQDAKPVLVDLCPAIEVIPEMTERTVLHAGPPVRWEEMCGPMRGAITGACMFEGWAKTPEDAVALAGGGELGFVSCHDHGAAGPMSGIITPSKWVYVVRNEGFGNQAYSGLYEGIGKVLRHGAYSDEVLQRLRWMNRELAPVMARAIARSGGIDIKNLIAEALQMGDEMHNRNRASSARFVLALVPHLVALGDGDLERIIAFMDSSGHFSLSSVMASCKATLDAAHGIADSTIVTVMARNGTEFGIRVSGLGERWFTAPAPVIDGVYFPGYGPEDANPDLGDSSITETAGLGSMAMAAAPAASAARRSGRPGRSRRAPRCPRPRAAPPVRQGPAGRPRYPPPRPPRPAGRRRRRGLPGSRRRAGAPGRRGRRGPAPGRRATPPPPPCAPPGAAPPGAIPDRSSDAAGPP